MRAFPRFSALSRMRFARLLLVAIGFVGTACSLLPTPDVTVKTLRSGSIAVDSTGVAFDLPSGVADPHPTLCMILDTLRYDFRPRAEKFHPLGLTDTTIYSRDAGAQITSPIALRGVLEGRNGERVESNSGGYGPGTGTDTPYNRAHLLDEGGEVVCLGWNLSGRVGTYPKLRLRSTRPIVVHDLSWHYFTGT